MWFHIIHVLHFYTGSKSDWVYAEPRFLRQLEVDPNPSRAAFEEMSRESAQVHAGDHGFP